MSPEIIALIVVAGGIIFFLLRRSSELPAPKQPPSELVADEQKDQIESGTGHILITHPLVCRAAEKVLADGGEAVKYIVRDGDRLYFSFDSIPDSVKRQRASDLIKGIQTGQDVNIIGFIQLMRQIIGH